MDFAPYQDTDPERERALSPDRGNRTLSPSKRNGARSPSPLPNQSKITPNPFAASSLPEPNHFNDAYQSQGAGRRGFGNNIEGGGIGADLNLFDTSLPLRLDYEAMLAYLLLPPAGGVLLLIVEHKSDYVRSVSRLIVWKIFGQ